jgi:hypothetical protein
MGGRGGGMRSSTGGKGPTNFNSAGSRKGGVKERAGTIERIHRSSMQTSDKKLDIKLDDGTAATVDVSLREASKLGSGKRYAFHLVDSSEKGARHSTGAKSYKLVGEPRPLAGQDKFKQLRDEKRNGGDDGGKGGRGGRGKR